MNLLDFPPEILVAIGDFLPTRYFLRLKSVCRYLYYVLIPNITKKLLDHQLRHWYKLRQALQEYGNGMDNSLMGSGKTYSTCALAKFFGLSLTVICPKTVKPAWKEAIIHFDIPSSKLVIMTYAKLRRTNIFLTVKPDPEYQPEMVGGVPVVDKTKKNLIIVQDAWIKRVLDGTMLVYDESHNLKNRSIQFKCGWVLASSMQSLGSKSKLLLVSGTPMDKIEQVIRYCQLLGIITKDHIARNDIQNGYTLEGMEELIDFCLPRTSTENSLCRLSVNPANKYEIAMELYEKYVLPKISSTMAPPLIDAELSVCDGLYNFPPEDLDKLAAGLRKLSNALALSADQRNQDFWEIAKFSLCMIEEAKLRTLHRLATMVLEWNPKYKVVIMLNYLKPLDEITELLDRYNPIYMKSNFTDKKREESIKLFNKPNRKGGARVLIANSAVASLGISLHDREGSNYRFMFINPDYSIIQMFQLIFRIHRVGTKGRALVRFLYAKSSDLKHQESSILRALARKSKFMERMKPEVLKHIKLPGQYPIFVEPDA